MITVRKVVLTVTRKHEIFSRYEALEFIQELSQIVKTWEKNKTPIIVLADGAKEITGYTVIEIPEQFADKKKTDDFINWCHENGFECGEYKTGEIFDTKNDRCFLCEMANHKGFLNAKLYNQHIDKAYDCVIYESENFYVTSEKGALKQGYLMIVPRKHMLSVAQFPKELMPEYQEVCRDVEHILLNTFEGSVVTFMEHGSGPSGKTSHKKSIVHAHTHVVVDWTLKEKYKRMVQLKPIKDIRDAKDTHYFSYQEGSDGQTKISMDPNVYIQRQYPRQIMAMELGLAPNQYQWRVHEFSEVSDATLFHISNYLKNDETEERIKERTKAFLEGFLLREKVEEEDLY